MLVSKWLDNKLYRRRQLKADKAERRIGELTEAIQGIDDELFPDIAQELRERRADLAFKLSHLQDKLRRKPYV